MTETAEQKKPGRKPSKKKGVVLKTLCVERDGKNVKFKNETKYIYGERKGHKFIKGKEYTNVQEFTQEEFEKFLEAGAIKAV